MYEGTRDEKRLLEADERSGRERLRRAAWERVRSLVERPRAVLGGAPPSRDEVHEP